MDDVRCPMCGKSNPPQSEVCQFCQARLSPLIVPPPINEGEPGTSGESDDLFPPGNGALPDWLDDLRDEDEAPAGDQGEEDAEDSTEIWSSEEEQRLSSAFMFSDAEESTTQEDWLARLTPEEESQAEDQAAVEAETDAGQASTAFIGMEDVAGEEDSSDWLAEFQTSSLGLEESAEVSPTADDQDKDASEEERPHWLDLIRAQQKKESEQAASLPSQDEEDMESGDVWGEEPAGEAGQSDWLSDIGVEEGEQTLHIASKDLPDWLVETGVFKPKDRGDAEQASSGWMMESELSEEEPASEAEEGLLDLTAAASVPDSGEPKEPHRDLPDWLSKMSEQDVDQSGLPTPVENGEGEGSAAEEEGSLPDWLTKLETTASNQVTGSSVPALILDDEDEELAIAGAQELELPADQDISAVPDWLSQIAAQEEQAEGVTPAEGELEPDLAAAQLPSWLQAMRPVETAAPSAPVAEEGAKLVEKVGPLAGLAGVLPAEPEFAHLSKPKSSLVKLQVSDSQQTHIALLENLLAEEGQAKTLAARPVITSQYFIRLLVALVILVSVIAPLWLNRQSLPLPDPGGVSKEVFDFNQAMAGLSSGVPVLIAFDYEPSFSGELDTLATAVVTEAAERGVQLVMVSTNPTGPILAERLMTVRLANSDTDYINLGYIPGGAVGLLAFAQNPREVNPFDMSGTRVWETAPLASVNSLSDFAMVMVMTESPDTARSWIEQVQPSLGTAGKPMLMVLSAQAEPMVRPYYDAEPRQVNGMISGLAGGAAFESISGAEGGARLYWDAFGAGLVIAAALILLGGIASLVMALLSKPDKSEVEGAL